MQSLARLMLATTVLLASTAADAASFEVSSSLDEPFSARATLDSTPRSVALASPEAYEARGLDYAEALDVITLRLDTTGGSPGVVFSSAFPVREPAFHLLIKLDGDPDNVIEFGVVLDAGGLTALPATPLPRAPARPRAEAASVGETPARPDSTPVRDPAPARAAAPVSTLPTSDMQHGPVQRGETLWAIARDHARRIGEPLSATMRAIADANPQAFIAGDINRLRIGAVLRLPGASGAAPAPTVAATPPPSSSPTATAEPTPAPRPAPSPAPAVTATAPAVSSRIQRIEAGIATVDATGSTLVETGAQLDQRLNSLGAKMQALRERMRAQTERVRELAERADRVGELARRADASAAEAARVAMNTASPLLPAGDAGQVADAGPSAPAASTPGASTLGESAVPGTSNPVSDLPRTEAPGAETPGSGVTETAAVEPSTPGVGVATPPVAAPQPAAPQAPVAATPDTGGTIPGAVRPAEPAPFDLQGLVERYGLPAGIAAGGVLVVALLVVVIGRLRRRRAADGPSEDEALLQRVAAKTGQSAEGMDLEFDESELANEILTEGALAGPDADDAASATPPGVSEVLTEIDVYVAYGQVDTARAKLEQGLEEFPDSQELRSRLDMLNNPQTLGTTPAFASLDEPLMPDPGESGASGDNVIPFAPRPSGNAALYDLGIATDSGDEDDDDPAGNRNA